MDECFDQSNKGRPLSPPQALYVYCMYVCCPGAPPLTMHWDENEGRQPGEQCGKQSDGPGGLHSISVELNPAHLLSHNGEVTVN